MSFKAQGICHRHVPPQLGALSEHHPDVLYIFLPLFPWIHTVDMALAAVGDQDAGYNFNGAAFPAPLGPI